MATGTLTGQTIANTYKSLLKVTGTTSGGETLHATTLKVIEDGDGNPSPIQLAQNRIEIVPTANHANAFEVSQADGTQIFNINSSTPGATLIGNLDISKDSADTTLTISAHHNTDATNPKLVFRKAGGSEASPTVVADGESLGKIEWQGYNADGTDYDTGGFLQFKVDATPSSSSDSSDMPTQMILGLSPDGSDTPTTRLNFLSSGAMHFYRSDGTTSQLSLDGSGNATIGNQVWGVNGSAAAPAYAFVNDGDTGMYLGGVGQLNFATGSNERFQIDSSGNSTFYGGGLTSFNTTEGIISKRNDGTDTKMQILNTHTGSCYLYFDASNGDLSGSDYAFIQHNNSNLNLVIQTEDSAGNIELNSKESSTMTLDGKSVGIGVGSPLARLHVQDTGVSTTSSFTGVQFVHTKTGGTTNASDHMTGLAVDMNFNDGSNFFGEMSGAILKATSLAASTGDTSFIKGAHIQAEMTGNTDVNSIYGLFNLTDINGGEVDSSAYGIFNKLELASGVSGTFTNYGYYGGVDADTDVATHGIYYEGFDHNDYHWTAYSADQGSIVTRMSDAGVIEAKTTTISGLDYAEYFESKDGKAIDVGTTVKLDGDKIVACEDGDTPIGVVRPPGSSGVVGGDQPFHWQGKHEKDTYGDVVMEDFTKTKWKVEVDEAEYYKRRDQREQQKYKRVDGSKAIPAKEAVVQQKVVDEEVEKEVTTTSLVDGKYVQKTETVTKTVQVPQYDEVDLYNEDGKVIGKYQVPIMETVEEAVAAVDAVPDTYFKIHKYYSDRIPDGLSVPDDAEIIKKSSKRSKLSSSYDASKEESYKSREVRDEWHIIGLLGQIPITKGQPLASNWIKMKDVSDTVEMYFVK